MKQTVTMTIGSQTIEIETGRMGKKADGSVVVTAGNNVVLVTMVSSKRESTMDFFPLTFTLLSIIIFFIFLRLF